MPDPLDPDAVFDVPALWEAARRAARGKRDRAPVMYFRVELERRLLDLRRELTAGVWRPGPVHRLRVRDPKPREISVPPFRDRVVHQALAAALSPRVERRLIRDCYACRVGAGTHAALRRATLWARTWRWSVHLDVERFFPSIDHAIVRTHLARDVPNPKLRAICERILAAGASRNTGPHLPGDDLFAPLGRTVGLPLGSLTSQLWANRYLDPVDHLVKDRLRVRGYLRYMDDMLAFHDDRRALEDIARRIEDACHALHVRLHPWEVRPTRGGVNFVGYRILPDCVRVRSSTVKRAERRLRFHLRHTGDLRDEGFRARLRSAFAHWGHADSWRLRERTLRRLGLLYAPLAE